MKNSVKWLIGFLVVVICSSCGKEESDDEPTTFVEGTWKKACYIQSDNTTYAESIFTFQNTLATNSFNTYSDSSCSTGALSLKYKSTMAVGSDATKADGSTLGTKVTLTLVSVYVTARTDALAAAYSTASLCGATNWTKDVEKDVTSNVTEDTCLDGQASGTVTKDVYKVVGTDFWWGDDDSDKDSDGYPTGIVDSGRDKQ